MFLDDSLRGFALSPDGILYYWSDGSVLARDPETGQTEELVGPDIVNVNIALSRDGKWLAFTRRAQELHVMPAEGGSPTELLRVSEQDEPVVPQSWLPDGETLLFTIGNGYERSLWTIDVAGGEPFEVGLSMEMLRVVRVHPDGKRISFTAGVPHLELWVMENFLPDSEELPTMAAH